MTKDGVLMLMHGVSLNGIDLVWIDNGLTVQKYIAERFEPYDFDAEGECLVNFAERNGPQDYSVSSFG